MIRYLWIVILLLCGCGASRHTSKLNRQEITEAAQVTQSGTEARSIEVSTVETGVIQNEEIVTDITEFDTALPVDPATGTPPVKRKTTQTKRTAMQAQQSVSVERDTLIEAFESRASTEKSNTSVAEEDISGRGLNQVQGTLCLFGILAILSLIVWVILNRLKR